MLYAYKKSAKRNSYYKGLVKILRLDYNNIMPDTLKLKGVLRQLRNRVPFNNGCTQRQYGPGNFCLITGIGDYKIRNV
jgi:hypothetical protein